MIAFNVLSDKTKKIFACFYLTFFFYSCSNALFFFGFLTLLLSCFHCNSCIDVLCGKVLNRFPIHTALYYLSIEFFYEVLNDPSL